MTTPGRKTVYRIVDRKTGKARGDLITRVDTVIDESRPLVLFHPVHTFRKKKVKNFRAINLLLPIFRDGKRVYDPPSLEEIRKYHREQLSLFWEEYLRILNPEEYPVDLSRDLWEEKQNLLKKIYASIREENGG